MLWVYEVLRHISDELAGTSVGFHSPVVRSLTREGTLSIADVQIERCHARIHRLAMWSSLREGATADFLDHLRVRR